MAILTRETPLRLLAGELRIAVFATPARSLRLVEAQGAGTAFDPGDGTLVVPAPEQLTVIAVAPAAGAAFPDGTVLTLTVGQEVELRDVNVSGLGQTALLRFEREGGALLVSTPYIGVRPGDRDNLSELGKRARTVTRELLGVPDLAEPLSMTILVDDSASMRVPLRDGALAAVLDILDGMAEVLTPGRQPELGLLGSSLRWITPGEQTWLSQAVESELANATWGLGARLGMAEQAPGPRAVSYLVTDAVPADLAAFRGTDSAAQQRLVVLAEEGVVAQQGEPGIPLTVIPPLDAEEGVAGRFEHDTARLRACIRSLLGGLPSTETRDI